MQQPKVIVIVRWNLHLGESKYLKRIQAMQSSGGWHDKRLEIWERYSMPSLQRQTWKDFEVWMLCEPQKQSENESLKALLKDTRFSVVTDWERARNYIVETGDPENTVVFCRMDSDDMYHAELINDFLEAIPRSKESNKSYIQAMQGYGLNVKTKKLYRWINPSPPFFCMIKKRADLIRDLPGGRGIAHHGWVKVRAYLLNRRPLFCVTINGVNICNSMTVPWLGKEIVGKELSQVQSDYGISDA